MSDFNYCKKTVRDIAVRGKRVLVRVDFNVPLTKDGTIADDTRIRSAMPTVNYLLAHGARVILMSHLGRPKGEAKPEFSLRVVAERLDKTLDTKVYFAEDCIGEAAEKVVFAMKDGEVTLLENLRFHKEEEKNDPQFAKALAKLGEIYVDDAFGTVHRAHASMAGVPEYLPAVSGLLLEKELVIMGKILSEPNRPFVAIMGGAKVSDKIGVIKNLLDKVDRLLIGGAMANTFLAAQGYDMQGSKVETDYIELAKELLDNDLERKICLPTDLTAAAAFDNEAERRQVKVGEIPAGWMALDIGDRTILSYAKIIASAKTVVWNGPMGVFEMKNFARGTRKVALAVARTRGTTIVGGGDSLAALEKAGVMYLVNHVSTGGGSTLAYLEGDELPGVAAIADLDNEELSVLADIDD
ncbi:MAG: phosphoglycerate kinase [Bacillota bacterium]